jgi:HAMP domain-containing protein
MISIIKKKIGLKISILLGVVMLVLIIPVALWIIYSQTKSLEELTIEKAVLAANDGAGMYALILENAIESDILSVSEVFDVKYEPIKGYNWGDNPKFHTMYDFYTDKSATYFQDAYLKNADFIYAVGQDINGYVPTHNARFQEPITNDPGKDTSGNRTKRIFKDSVGQGASQNVTPGFRQVYVNDVGKTFWDVSSPVYVKGKHWGCFRIGVSVERIEAKKKDLLILLFVVFGIFTVVVTGTIFIVVRRTVKPIEQLTQTARDVSVGKGLDEKIIPHTEDEIGALTKAVDRLRLSLKAAMERLGE